MNTITYVGKHLLTMSVVRHVHDSWELIYCTDGNGVFHFEDDREIPYREGEIVVIPPHTVHSNSSDSGFTNIHVNMTDALLPFREPTLIQDDSNRFIYQAFCAVNYHFNSSDERRRRTMVSAYGDLICSALTAYYRAQPLSKTVEEIESSIIQNYQDCNYELDKYLQTFPFSYDYLRKLFKKELGVSPHRYLADKRLQAAADILAASRAENPNIAYIAQTCGFREPLYFSRMFKKKFGVAPSYYAEHHGLKPAGTDPEPKSR